jgi:thiamine-phosphate pyrophosphorylase
MASLPRRPPIICFVTDRRRWAADAGSQPSVDEVVARVRAAAYAGIDLVQVREPDLHARALCSVVGRCVAAVRGTSARVLVNERADVAITAGADGVHLRASSMAVGDVRQVAPPGFIVGRSVHRVEDVAKMSASGADYLIAGTVFPSRSKPLADQVLGVAGVRAIADATEIPVLAIGGLSLANVTDIARAGIAGIAAIDLFAAAGASIEAWQSLLTRIREPFE